MRKVLFLSNGAGEDAVASRILSRLDGLVAEAVPLVGEGTGYPPSIERVGPRRVLPSEGLVRESVANLLKDILAGLPLHHLRQLQFLRRRRRDYSLTVAVGDLLPVTLAGLAGHSPVLFVGTAKSVWHHQYSLAEVKLLRRYATFTLARDEPTAQALRQAGLAAAWVGNAMMDELEPSGLDFGLEEGELGLAIFPGSREGAYREFPRQLEVFWRLVERGVRAKAVTAVASSIDVQRLGEACSGWSLDDNAQLSESGILATLARVGAPPVLLVRGALGDVLAGCAVALGQAGTANEQAAGLGLPVVAYAPGGESRLGWYRGRQKGLLGDAVRVVEDELEAVVDELELLFREPRERRRRGDEGRARMGPAGGAGRMAAVVRQVALGQDPRPESPP